MKLIKRRGFTWVRVKIDDKHGRLAGVLLGLAFAIGLLLYCAMTGGVR